MAGEAFLNGGRGGAGRWWWISLGGLVVLLLAMTVQKIWGADTWWQLATGRWMVEHRGVPRVDVFSYTAAGREWIELRWLFCLGLYLGWQVGGPALLIAGQVVMIGATWVVIAWPSRRALVSPGGAAVLGIALTAGLGRWVLRPELTTYLLAAVFLVELSSLARGDRGETEKRAGRFAGCRMAALQVVWVNAHTLFVMGPVLCWVFVAGDAAQRGWVRRRGGAVGAAAANVRLVAIAVGVSAACLVNPYFVRGALFPVTLWREIQAGNVMAANIGEFKSPLAIPLSRWTPDLYAAAALVVLGGASFALRRRVDLARVGVFVAGAYLAAKAQRNIGLLSIMGGWAALANLSDAAREASGSERWASRGATRAGAHVAIGLACVGLAWHIASDRMWEAIGAPRETGVGVAEFNTPEETARFLKESGARGPVFNAIRDGGYFEWALPEIPVFTDGRLEVFGEELLAPFFGVNASNWNALASRWGFRIAVVPAENYADIAGMLYHAPEWKLVHIDHRAFVFARTIPENEPLISRYAVDAPAPLPAVGDGVLDPPLSAWKRAIGTRLRPWRAAGLAEAYVQIGALERAGALFEEALREAPGHRSSMATLAAIDRFRGEARGRELYAKLGAGSEWTVYSDRQLAGWLDQAGKKSEAAEALERIVAAQPEDRTTRVALADEYFQLKDFARARDHYARALKGTSGPAPDWLKFGFACEQSGDVPGAIAAYRVSLAADPKQAAVYNQLGKALASQGDLAGAAGAFREALRLRPDFRAAQENLDALKGRTRAR